MVRGWSHAWLLAGLAAVAFGETGVENDECTTPGGVPGRCVPVRECEYVREILRRQAHYTNDTEYVGKLRCGIRPGRLPLVCCPRLKNDDLCGPVHFPERIIGGEESSIVEFPWMVLLRFEARNKKIHANCAGSLIGGRFVLTAAHCFASAQKKGWKLVSVRVAEWNYMNYRGRKDCKVLPGFNETICRMDYEIARYTIHPGYKVNYAVHINDIALIELVTDVKFDGVVKPICLPLDDVKLPQPDGLITDYIAAGWGSTSPGAGMNHRLMKVELNWFDSVRCEKVFPIPSGTGIGEVHICAGGVHGQDTCHGDSGGPLMQEHAGTTFLVGITSFGWPKCGREGIPGVYTNVSQFLGWIQYEVFRGITV
uniref:CLIP domain-containing serine protease n=1 Tax=Anopheles atroparvus TaxID=41427 RepID=A0AAG5DI48_ANOAO